MKRYRVIALLVALVLVVTGALVGCEKKPEAQGAAERGGLLDAQGYGVQSWNGGDISLYSDAGSTRQVYVEGSQGLVKVVVPTAVATATPAVLIDNQGSVANSLEIRKNATPVFYVDVDGNVTYTGMSSAGGLISAAVGVRAPTAVGTATPGFFVDSTGGVSVPFEVRYNATPVAAVSSVGGVSGSTIIGSSYVQALRKVTAKTGTAVTLTAAEVSLGLVSDLGDSGGITITLPAAVAGYDVLIYNKTGNDMKIDCDAADQIFDLTNAAGNSITNTTAYDYVHLIALDATGWYTLDVHGTWTDAD